MLPCPQWPLQNYSLRYPGVKQQRREEHRWMDPSVFRFIPSAADLIASNDFKDSLRIAEKKGTVMSRIHRIQFIYSLLVMGGVSTFAAGPDDWPSWRGNPSLDAHSSAKGAIGQATIAASVFVGRVDCLVAVEFSDASHELKLPSDETTPANPLADPQWGHVPQTGLIEGVERTWQNSTHMTYADVGPDMPGLEKIEFESGFSLPTINGQWQPARGRCYAWKDSAWSLVWETDPIPMVFHSMPLTGDFDADGDLEVAFLPWYELVVLDAATGKVEDRCRFTEGRSYGFFGVYDLDADGTSEFVIEADFSKHVDVLGYRDGKLAVLWQRAIEPDISNPQKVLRVNPNPVADVDGDGRKEVLVSLYKGSGENRWRLTVHDGITGAVKTELADEYLEGVFDLDDDGSAELLTTRAVGAGIPTHGGARVFKLREGKAILAWEDPSAGWQTWAPPLPPNVSTGATLGNQTVLCRSASGQTWAALRPVANDAAVSVAEWTSGGFRSRFRVEGPRPEVLGLSTNGSALVRGSYPVGRGGVIRASHADVRILGSQRAGVPAASPAVANQPDGSRTIVVQGADEELVVLRADAGSPAPVETRRIAGRGTCTAWPTVLAPVLGALRGGGSNQLLYATASPEGCARLVAQEIDGTELWHHDFPNIPGGPPVWNVGGLLLWQTGHFTSKEAEDVLVTVRRSMMHSEETCMLSGKDGRELWHRDRQVSSRGVGGIPFAIADFDGDGLDDAASLHPSIVYILKGTDGSDIIARDATWDPVPSKPVYWGRPVAVNLDPARPADLFMAGSAMTGLIRNDGSLAWWDALDRSGKEFAFGDFDADGQSEAIGAGFDDGARCYDIATGKVEWTLGAPFLKDVSGAASADINSDGRDEALFSSGKTLYGLGVAGEDHRATVLWQLDFPVNISTPAIAATNSNAAQIFVTSENGYLHVVR